MKKEVGHFFSTSNTLKTILLNLAIFILYTVAGKIGLSLSSVNPSTTAIWPPTGIALAALLLFGNRVIPAIFIGAFFVNITTAGGLATSIGIAIGNTLEGFVGAYLVKRYSNGIHTFSTVVDIFKFLFLAAFLSTTISANIGVITLILGKLANWKDFFPVWITWWLGDMGGDLFIAPFLIIWGVFPRIRFDFKEILNLLLSFFVLLVTTDIVFFGILPYPYLCIPVAVWIAFWFGRRGATIATAVLAGIGTFYTIHGLGPFSIGHDSNQAFIYLELFLAVLTITSLCVAALVHTLRKSEKTLASHEARFKALIEKSFDSVVLIDTTSKILYASPSVKQVLGYTPEELIGITGFNLVAPADRTMTIRELAKLVLKPGGTVNIEYRVMQKNGNAIWVEATGTNLLFDPEINAVVINFRDITEKKALQEKMLQEKIQDEAMLASIGDGIIATDNQGIITMVNHAACMALGWKRSELIGKLIFDKIPMEEVNGKLIKNANRPLNKVLSQRRKVVTAKEYYYVKKDKTKFPVRFTVTPITIENKIVGIIEVFHDITKEKEIEKMKDEFISMASHELRTPMTAVRGLLSMISNGDYGPVNEQLKHPLENIQISAERQIHLINDLLNVSRLQTGKIDFTITDFSLKQTLDEVVKSLMPIAQEKGLQLKYENKEDLFVHADIDWTKHILNNLIGNALKFTDQGNVFLTYKANIEVVTLTVTDSGTGIESDDRKKLFGKFQQLNGQISGKPPGSGLGLFLSRELARKMGGDVQLYESSIGRGSTFALTLPRGHMKSKNEIKKTEVIKKKIAFSPNKR